MQMKVFCPHCGRCLGECNSSNNEASCKVLVSKPSRAGKKYFIHDMKCMKCKNEIFILMEFKD